jgi:suppressor of G2 allele of SKP1
LQAIEIDPDNAAAHAARAGVHNRLKRYVDAVADAARATELDPHLTVAHRQQAMAYFELEEYESAKESFETAFGIDERPADREWMKMAMLKLGEELPKEPPREHMPTPTSRPMPLSPAPEIVEIFEEPSGPSSIKIDDPEYSKYWRAPLTPAAVPDTAGGEGPASAYRHQWFQSVEKVEVNVLAKGLPKDRVAVSIKEQRLEVAITDSEGKEEYRLELDLHAPVDPGASRFEVLGTKVEIQMKKASPGKTWPGLTADSKGAEAPSQAEAEAKPAGAPYPYAGKKIDWDKVQQEIVEEESKEKPEGDAVGSVLPVSSFLPQLHPSAGCIFFTIGSSSNNNSNNNRSSTVG